MRSVATPAAIAACLILSGSAAAGAASLPAAEVEHDLAGLASWSADFRQTIEDANGKVLRRASGHLYLQRPGKFRWDYTEPSEQLVLADGKKLWFYDKDLAQANVRDMDSTLASTPAVLLVDDAPVSSQFTITALAPQEGLRWYQLIPKHPDTDFQAIRIGFADGELAQMLLADKLNQVTRLTFTHALRNVKLSQNLFTFTPPAGVDVIGRPAP